MDQNSLSRFFPLSGYIEPDTEQAIDRLREPALRLAEAINEVLTEGQAKNEMIMTLFHLIRNVEMSLKLDGPAKIKSMLVIKQ